MFLQNPARQFLAYHIACRLKPDRVVHQSADHLFLLFIHFLDRNRRHEPPDLFKHRVDVLIELTHGLKRVFVLFFKHLQNRLHHAFDLFRHPKQFAFQAANSLRRIVDRVIVQSRGCSGQSAARVTIAFLFQQGFERPLKNATEGQCQKQAAVKKHMQ